MNGDDDLDRLLELARRFCLARFGQTPRSFRLRLWDRRVFECPVPSVPTLPAYSTTCKPAPVVTQPHHSDDYRVVRWPGLGEMRFSAKQAAVVKTLWDAMDGDDPEVDQPELLRAAGSDGDRLRDLFRNHGAWGTLIVATRGGSYRLADLTGEVDATE